jgi:hypothetical protein
MGDGLSRLARIYEPSNPKELHPGSFKEFRFHCRPSTPADEAAENREQYKTFTGRSLVEAITTKGTRLTFESHYHPYFIDRLNAALAKSKLDENGALTLQ